MARTRTYRIRNELPRSLEETLSSVKGFRGEYESEPDYSKVLERIKDTNPFSVLVFYETPEKRISLAQRKKLNPSVPGRILSGIAGYVQFYFTPELEEMRIGAWIGSGYRSTQSTYALALARLSSRIDVPTHILIYDRQNFIKCTALNILKHKLFKIRSQLNNYGH